MKQIKALSKDIRRIEKRLAAEYGTANDLLNELKQIEQDKELSDIKKDVRRTKKTLRWLKFASSRLSRNAGKVDEDLRKIEELHPPEEISKSIQQVKDAYIKRIELLGTLVTRYSLGKTGEGKINKDIEMMKTLEKKLEKRKNKPEFGNLKNQFDVIVKKSEEDVKFLITWIRSTETVVKNIKRISQELKKLSS
jgi:hypothetical protein